MWPPVFTIDNLVGPGDLGQIAEAAAGGTFVDGSTSTGGINRQVKHNQEMAPGEAYLRAARLIERALRDSDTFNQATFPRAMTRPILSRYAAGMGYGEHVDSAVIGYMSQSRATGAFGQNYVRSDFAMTIFLADPDSYDGGELHLEIPAGHQRYKLPAGSAALYPPGIPHSVVPVSRGTRLAAVLWIQSMIDDHERRQLVTEVHQLARHLATTRSGSPEAELAMEVAAHALRLSADV
jgi:PKHD-type hydroxylase